MTINNDEWFTEISSASGLGFSLKIHSKLHQEQSAFQKIEIFETEHFGRLMVIDGFIMLTSRDNFIYHEMMSHPALFTHPNPERVLIIGGGDCGTLREVLKHPQVKHAHQVDIDERVTRLSEQYFPELCERNNDPRAQLAFEDGIAWVSNAQPNSYDVIIVDSTDPIGPGEVLFTTEFYQQCHRVLGDNGIFVQQSESPLLHTELIIQPMHQRLERASFSNRRLLLFPQCTYPSGWWSCTLASSKIPLDQSPARDIASLSTQNHYYNSEIHEAAAALPEFLTIFK